MLPHCIKVLKRFLYQSLAVITPQKNILVNKEKAKVLRKKGTLECTRKSETLENDIAEIRNLNLRNLSLEENDIVGITNILEQKNGNTNIHIKSINFSYNQLIGDVGATLIAKKYHLLYVKSD